MSDNKKAADEWNAAADKFTPVDITITRVGPEYFEHHQVRGRTVIRVPKDGPAQKLVEELWHEQQPDGSWKLTDPQPER